MDGERILIGDCLHHLQDLAPGSVDLIFADPPYNLQLGGELYRPNNTRVDGVEAAWDRFDGFADYDAFTRAWLGECRRVLKKDGSLWVIGSYHNIFRVGAVLQDLGFWVMNDVVWRKTNPMPNFRGTRFTNAHETLIWAARSPDGRPFFNYDAMKRLNDDLQMRSDWLLPICSGPERLRTDDGKTKAHPTQKPEALLYRVVLSTSRPGDLVLDPFLGTGTTGVVARRLGRRFVGIEQDPAHAERARARIAATPFDADPEVLAITPKRQEPRIPFGQLVESGMIRPGETLADPSRRFAVRVRADGTVIGENHTGRVVGSIHKVGALLQGAPSCNGWIFWHVRQANGHWVPIDVYRQKVRAELA